MGAFQQVLLAATGAPQSTANATFRQSISRYDGSQALTYPSVNVAGNLLVGVSSSEGSLATATISETNGNTWTSAGPQFDLPSGAGPGELRIWYVPNCNGGANTVTINTAASDFSWAIYEFGNIVTSSPVDVQKQTFQNGNTTTPTSDAFTTTQRDLIFFCFADEQTAQAGAFTAGTGYVMGESHTNHVDAQQYSLGSSAGSKSPFITCVTSTATWGLWCIGFKIIGG